MMDLSVNISISSSRDESDPPSVPPPSMSIDKLFPALLECFGIILCGYVAGRANIIPATQANGLGNFVSKFALPALLFKNMVLLDFGNVIWPFFFSILVAKVTVFFFVCVLTLLVANRESCFSKAGLFSIFATQSNDFALGFPIVEALYQNTHPEYLQYIYLVAPVSLMVLNPLGFAFCEIQRWRTGEPHQHSKLHVLGVVVLQVFKNPIVFMVVIGVISHFLLGQKIPPFMEEFIDGLANSFGGVALFYLGLSMVGQLKKLTRSTVVALILLITAKLLMMPLICRGMVELLDCGNTSSLNHTSLSNYAFLYGVFPTAPSVAIYASHYNMELEVVTSGMVISTFLSAPIMYVSAWLLTIPWMDPMQLASALQNVSFNISIISLFALALFLHPGGRKPTAEAGSSLALVNPFPSDFRVYLLSPSDGHFRQRIGGRTLAGGGGAPGAVHQPQALLEGNNVVWSVAVMLLSRKFFRIPHIFTINLFVAQLLACVGMIVWNFVAEQDNFLGQVLTFTLLYGSLYSTYIWPGLIALSLLLLRRNEEVKVRSGLILITGWGIPVLALSVLLLSGERMPDTIDSAFFYGWTQVMCTCVVLFVSIVVCGVSLTLLSRGTRDYHTLKHRSLSGSEEDLRPSYDTNRQTTVEQPSTAGSISAECQMCECDLVQPMPDMITSPREETSIQAGQCSQRCASTHCLLVEEEQKQTDGQNTDIQSTRHVLVCLLLSVSLLSNLSSCLWWLFNKVPGRLYLELQFFCVVANYGQGFISFAFFGLDKHVIISPFKKRLMSLWQGWGQEVTGSAGSEEIRLTCSQFLTYHKEQCVRDIVHKKRCGECSTTQAFLGSDMVRWLQSVGLASDQGEALAYGSRLLEGGVILHITHEHGFQDEALHYRFT
ncbi:integral membrane protein GPR155-like isoform X1 [Myxocyprinus asiaticus]|uniref:integral membrane protein GPR155-like isoform X1 n=1 Tax=Myxocyprinus asiaticus TaxID=70543 RepID=UPI0022232591|nr:integral membrane protein GPR155-like isoform X1 [Myxocyprinus asiaticus]